jgi:hypothetical protein
MLRSEDFSEVTTYAGLLGNALDLFQHIVHPSRRRLWTSSVRSWASSTWSGSHAGARLRYRGHRLGCIR